VRLVFAGTPDAAVPSLQALMASRHEVAAVLTRPDSPAGRGRALRPSPVRETAQAAGLPVLTPASPRDPQFHDELRALAPDCCPVVAYGALLPQPVLDIAPLGWVNLHFSLLPAWRGAAPVQHAVLAGDELTGATTFRLEAGMDTGPVLGVSTERVNPHDTSGDLLERLARVGAGLLVATLDGLEEGRLVAVPQPAGGVSLAPKLTTDDARVDWTAPAQRVDRLIRACTPAPGAWTMLRGARVKLGPVTLVDDEGTAGEQDGGASLPPGQLRGDRVGTGAGAVRLGTVRPEGRSMMPAADWLRGLRLDDGERFG